MKTTFERGELRLKADRMRIMNKKDIRRDMLNKRNKMTKDEVKELSKRIGDTLKKMPAYTTSKTIMLYLSFGNEINSREIIMDSINDGKTIVLPYCNHDDKSITPTKITSTSLDLTINKMGYAQPNEESLDPIDQSEIDLIVVPGIAFDRKGFRVGFGAGYYDRFLGKIHFDIPTIGLAYDFQIVESFIEIESYDIPLDYILTEERIIVRTE